MKNKDKAKNEGKNKLIRLKNIEFNFRLTPKQIEYIKSKTKFIDLSPEGGLLFAQVSIRTNTLGEVFGKFIPAHVVDKLRPLVKKNAHSVVVLKNTKRIKLRG